ncbi:uncharacterized protein LOC135120568 [Zophobas morio]|uniref:uncharacterized protein LOC135120568 n=1 Tax=Zophobas morio TaxID=2755281 RepID=UPI003083969A
METKAEWIIASFGCYAYGFPVVTLYATLGHRALLYGLNETEASHIITDASLLKTLLKVVEGYEGLTCIIYSGTPSQDDLNGFSKSIALVSLSEVLRKGAEHFVDHEPFAPETDNLALIMYTSGTTGAPKGVMLSHRNLLAFIGSVQESIPRLTEKDRYIGYLPLAHVLELVCEIKILGIGACIGYGTPTTLSDVSPRIRKGTKGDVSELKPTLMAAVPAILDRIRKGITDRLESLSPPARFIFDYAFNTKLERIKKGLNSSLWDLLVFNRAKKMLGGEVRLMLSGGAPLSVETQSFISVVICPVGQGYGLTETCGGVTISQLDALSCGAVGGPFACCEVKLVDYEEGGYKTSDVLDPDVGLSRGEVIVSGSNIAMGYFKNDALTNEAFITHNDGKRWFHTGDIGRWNSDGSLSIIDRKKDIVKLQMGEYLSLGKVETILMGSHYVDNIMVYADSQLSYAVALVVPNSKELENLAHSLKVEGSFKEICENQQIMKKVYEELSKIGARNDLERFERPAKIHLVTEQWTPDSEFVTASLKLKRNNIKKYYSEQLKALCSD